MILCCGEALIDMIPSTNQSGEPGFTPHPGGAAFNTAIALGRLRILTGFLSGMSSDLFGDQLRTALAGSNVDAELAITSDRPTTLAFVQLTGVTRRTRSTTKTPPGGCWTRRNCPTFPTPSRRCISAGSA